MHAILPPDFHQPDDLLQTVITDAGGDGAVVGEQLADHHAAKAIL